MHLRALDFRLRGNDVLGGGMTRRANKRRNAKKNCASSKNIDTTVRKMCFGCLSQKSPEFTGRRFFEHFQPLDVDMDNVWFFLQKGVSDTVIAFLGRNVCILFGLECVKIAHVLRRPVILLNNEQ